MSKEQRRETSRNRFTVGRAKSSLIGGIAAFAFMASAEGCQESDKTTLPEPSPVSTRFAPEPPKITFDSQEAKKKAELEAFNRKITSVVNYMSQSEIPEFSYTASRWKKLASEKNLFIIRLQEWEEGAKIGLTSRGESLVRIIALNPRLLQNENQSLESSAILFHALDIQSTMLKEALDAFKIEGDSLDAGIKNMASHPSFPSINAEINALGWKRAMERYNFAQVNTDMSKVGEVARLFQSCKQSGNFDDCWNASFAPPKRPTAFDINQGIGQTSVFSHNSHVARS